jgi:EPS-associated MarR family transcriptional regulator
MQPVVDPDPNFEVRQLDLMRILANRPDISQRALSRELGLSLGKTHYVLHALLDKGLVKARNFRRSDNKLAYAYLLTAAGVREKMRMTRDFLSRKEVEFEKLRTTIANLRAEVADSPGGDAA